MSRSAAATCGASTPWTTFGGDNARTGYNACEMTLDPTAVPNLKLLWKAPLSSVSVAQPTYAPGVVVDGVARNLLFEADEHGLVQALDADSGGVVWSRNFGSQVTDCTDMPDEIFGVSGAPVLDLASGIGYVAGGDDRVHAIDITTGDDEPGWAPITIADPTLDHVYGALTLASGMLYATTASYCDYGTYYGKVVAVDVATRAVKTWMVVDPAVTPNEYGGGVWGPGGVSVDDTNGAVYAATGNSIPTENAGYAEQIVRLDRDLNVQAADYVPLVGTDVDYGSTPLLFTPPGCPAMLAAENKSGTLVVFDRDSINAGPVQTLHVASVDSDSFVGIPAYSPEQNMVYVTNSAISDDHTYGVGILAFSITNNCTLSLTWQTNTGPNFAPISPPTIANGVVYYGDGPQNTLLAYDATTGSLLWSSADTIGGNIYAAPTVVDGKVFVPAWDGKLYAFGVSGATAGPVASVGDATVVEGNSSNRAMSFRVTLSQPATSPVTVNYAVTSGTATVAMKPGTGVDVTAKTAGSLVFKTNSRGVTPTMMAITAEVWGNTAPQPNRTFHVTITSVSGGATAGQTNGIGTIIGDDSGPGGLTVGVGDASIVEGNTGSRSLAIPVTLSDVPQANVGVSFTVAGVTATYGQNAKVTGADFGGKTSGTVAWAARGTRTGIVTVPIWPDNRIEGDETFTITISNPTGGVTIVRASGTGTIIDDD